MQPHLMQPVSQHKIIRPSDLLPVFKYWLVLIREVKSDQSVAAF